MIINQSQLRHPEYQYLDLCQDVLRYGTLQANRTSTPAITLDGAMMQFDLARGFPVLTTKKVAWERAFGELIGFLRAYDNADQFAELGCNWWYKDANENTQWLASPYRKGENDLGRIYGCQWRDWKVNPGFRPARLRDGLVPTYLGRGNGEGKTNHPLGKTWEGMMARCYDEDSVSFPLYGARGVTICSRWLEFKAFAEDAEKLPGWDLKQANFESFAVQLDKDIRGDGFYYSPETCCWASSKANQDQKRIYQSYVVEKDGVEYSFSNVSDFCKEQGVEPKNFSDLWTGNKNAKMRGGFRFVRIDEIRKKEPSIDQVQQALDAIRSAVKTGVASRRIIINAWRPDEFDQMALPPCHVAYEFMVNVEKKELNMSMWQRSCDMFLGVPMNIANSALMLHLFAAATGLKPRRFTHFLSDVHIYQNHVEQVQEQLTRQPLALPRLTMVHEQDALIWTADDMAAMNPKDLFLPGYESHAAIRGEMSTG